VPNPSLDGAIVAKVYGEGEEVLEPNWLALGTGDRPRSAQLDTLADAAQLIADLEQFRQARPVWDRCAEMLLRAARSGRKADIAEATSYLLIAVWIFVALMRLHRRH
jgi:hypothetical protein